MSKASQQLRSQLLQALAEYAYQYRPEGVQLSSGGTTTEYIDCRTALSHPAVLNSAGHVVLAAMAPDSQAIGGLTMGADPLAIATSVVSAVNVPWFSVRKAAKAHGLGKRVEGGARPGLKVTVVEDVSTTGKSALEAVKAVQEEQMEVTQVLIFVNRSGAPLIRDAVGPNIPVDVLFTEVQVFTVGRARRTAIEAHHGQTYGDKPYTSHLEQVVSNISRWIPFDEIWTPDLLAAAWLHDTPEDTKVTLDQLRQEHPGPVCNLVEACTDGPGTNRKARKERPFTVIPKTPNAIVVKLADRIANVENAVNVIQANRQRSERSPELERRQSLVQMYQKEQPELFRRLQDSATTFPEGVRQMWAFLNHILWSV